MELRKTMQSCSVWWKEQSGSEGRWDHSEFQSLIFCSNTQNPFQSQYFPFPTWMRSPPCVTLYSSKQTLIGLNKSSHNSVDIWTLSTQIIFNPSLKLGSFFLLSFLHSFFFPFVPPSFHDLLPILTLLLPSARASSKEADASGTVDCRRLTVSKSCILSCKFMFSHICNWPQETWFL